MSQKRYGPTLDAGTVVIEKDAEKTIDESVFGSTAYTGVLERGTPGEVMITTGKKDMIRKAGTYMPDSLLPDNCVDFWDASAGAGVLFLNRVTDGTEVKSTLTLWDRKVARNKVIRVDAHDGGWWGGRKDTVIADVDDVEDIGGTGVTPTGDQTKIKLPDLYVVAVNKWKGGTVTIHSTGGDTTYDILSNTIGSGTIGAQLTLADDSRVDDDFDISTDTEIILRTASLNEWGQEKHLAVLIKDGQVKPTTEWGIEVYLAGELVFEKPDLSSDPQAANYFVNLINDDASNRYITVADLWTGAITDTIRPANWYGGVADTNIAAKVITLDDALVVVDSSAAGANTVAAFTFGADVIEDVYELEYTAAWALASLDKQQFHTIAGVPVTATPFVADNAWSIGFTVTESAPSATEKFTIYVIPLPKDEAIDGKVFFPDEGFAPAAGWQISDNEENDASIIAGDMTDEGAVSGTINVRLQYAQQLVNAEEGIWGIDENDFQAAYDVNTSPFNDLDDQDYGLIKHATPGITDLAGPNSVTVQKTYGMAYAESRNHQFRAELPQATETDEAASKAYVNNTLGRNDYLKVCMSSHVKVTDPVLTGRLKTVPTTGMIHGEEAKMAKAWSGYHKAAAGLVVKFPKIKELLTGTRKLDGELLNGAGLQRIVIKKGNFVLWGARTIWADSAWKFAIHREQMSYYEHVLQESYDWIIFAINDEIEQDKALAAAQSFFLPEWRVKRALQGSSFAEAVTLKIDDENNTPATRGAGDMSLEVSPWLADMVERFVITINKQGIFEARATA